MPVSSANQLSLLSKLSQQFATSNDIEQSLRFALTEVVSIVGAEAGSVFILNRAKTQLICGACEGPIDISGLKIDAKEGIVGNVVQTRQGKITDNKDPDFTSFVDKKTGFSTKNLVTAPLMVDDDCLGAVQLINATSRHGKFSLDSLETLKILASIAALAYRNAELTATAIEQTRIKREVELAREVQQSLLDLEPPLDGSIAGVNIAAREVSGDFYSVSEFIPGKVHFCIADVSGKGAHAGIMMARVATLWRMMAKQDMELNTLVSKINTEILETNFRGMFCTFVAGVVENNTVFFSNAGHEPILQFDGRDFSQIASTHPPLGITAWKDSPPIHSLPLEDGTVYMYTDGITDGLTKYGVPLTLDGLTSTIREVYVLPPEIQATAISRRVSFDEARLKDDVTLLVIGPQQH